MSLLRRLLCCSFGFIMYSFRRLLRLYIRLQLPSVMALFFSVFAFVNSGILPGPEFAPLTTLIFLFYWACYWPRLMHPLFLFVIGLLEDALSGGVIGVRSLLYLIIYSLVLSQRRLILKEPFPVVWIVFAVSSAIYVFASQLAFRLFEGTFYFSSAPLLQWMVTVAAYPLLHQLCLSLQTYLVYIRPMSGRRL